MSYINRVLKDNPVGFWSLESSSTSSDVSNGIFVAGSRTYNNATLSNVVYTDVQPIVTGGTAACRMSTNSTITISNSYNMFYRGTEEKSFSIDFWLDFYSIPTSTNVLKIGSNIILNFSDNLATLSIKDNSDNYYYSYCEVESYDSQLYVSIVYSSNQFRLFINGKSESSALMNSEKFFSDSYSSPPAFVFGPAGTGDLFVIDCISMYNYPLSETQIINRLTWGFYDNNPSFYTLQNSGGHLDIQEGEGLEDKYFIFNNQPSWLKGKFDNCIVDAGNLTSKYIPDSTMYNPVTTKTPALPKLSTDASPGTTQYDVTNGGLKITSGSDAVRFEDFDKYYDPQTQSITAQVYYTSTATQSAYLSITGFNFGQIIVERNAAGTGIRLYSPEGGFTGGTSGTAVFTGLTTGTWNNILITIDGSKLSFKVGSATAVDLTRSDGAISISSSTVYVGNAYVVDYQTGGTVSSYPSINPVKNVSIHMSNAIPADYSTYGQFTLSFNRTLSVSQRSTWEILLPLDTTNSVVGSSATIGTSSKNVVLSARTSTGSYSNQTVNGEKLPNYPIGSVGVPMYVKLTMDTVTSSRFRPKVSFLEIASYSDLTSYSNGKSFKIAPYTATSYTHTYQYKYKKLNILSRQPNFGIHFEPDSGMAQGAAIVTPESSYQTIEFWFRVNSTSGTGTSNICYINTGTPSILSYSNSTLSLVHSGFSSVYINGAAYTSATKTLIAGEIYHFVGVVTATTVTPYLNASSSYTGSGRTTIGEICLYSDAKNATFIANKYKSFLGTLDPKVITDAATISSVESAPRVYASKWHSVVGAVE